MANPIQYTPQFVPTDFNTLRDVLGMYRQDLAGRDQMFDQGAASRDSMLTELYSQETYDPDVLKSEVDKFSTKMDELVTRYGGDYGAAAKEIARLGTKEFSNPLYQLNRRKVEQVKNLEQLMARNPNLMALKDPRKVKLGQNVAQEDLQYEVADPADIQKAFNSIYGPYKDRITQSGLVNAPGRPGVLQYSTTKGLTKEQIAQMQQDDNTYNTILGQLPQLKKYMDNPEVATWFKNQVSQSLPGLEGGSQLDYIDDPSFVKGGKSDDSFSPRAIPLAEVSSKLIERQYKPFDKVDELFDPAKVSEDPIRAARVKDEIKSRMLNPEFNPKADKDAVVPVFIHI